MSRAAAGHSSPCAEFDVRVAGAALDSPGAELGDTRAGCGRLIFEASNGGAVR